MRFRSRALSASFGALALVLGSVAAPALAEEVGPAPAGTMDDDCNNTGVYYPELHTSGAWWYDICPQSGSIAEGETTNRYDGLDDVGFLTAVGISDIPLVVPQASATTTFDGTTFTASWTDPAVDLGGGTVVDVHVVLTIKGTYARWTITATDSVTDAPVAIPVRWEGDLGSDSDSTYDVSGPSMLSYGDQNDPLLLWNVEAGLYSYLVSDGDDGVEIEAEDSEVVITLALMDFGCPSGTSAAAAYTYALTVLPTFASTFGASLVAPDTEKCVTIAPATVKAGTSFSLTPAVTLNGFDFDPDGGSFYEYYGLPEWATIDTIDNSVPGVTPGLLVMGTAPTTPGVYQIPVYVWDGETVDTASHGIFELTVTAELAATGSETPWGIALGALLALAAGAGLMLTRRRTA